MLDYSLITGADNYRPAGRKTADESRAFSDFCMWQLFLCQWERIGLEYERRVRWARMELLCEELEQGRQL